MQNDPLWVFMFAIKRGFTVEQSDALRLKRIKRNEQLARVRTLWAEERHSRWRDALQKKQTEDPGASTAALKRQIVLEDWQRYPEDWPRDRYPASKSGPDDIDRHAYETALERLKKSLQKNGNFS